MAVAGLYYLLSMKKKSFQKGLTLVLALLLMTAIMAVSLALSTIIVREMRLSQNIKQSTIAYYGAESGLERALYEYYQVSPLYEIPSNLSGQVPVGFPGFDFIADWRLDSVVSETEVTANLAWEEGVKEVPLYNVVSGETWPNLSNVYISWNETGDQPKFIEWTLLYWETEGGFVKLDPKLEGAKTVKEIVDAKPVLNRTIRIPVSTLIGANTPALLRFKHVGAGGQGLRVNFTVTADDTAGTALAIGQETGIKVTGTSLQGQGDISRALQVTIPRKPPAFGVFDYLLFSDTGISKEWQR
jgi:hypothetical protein